MFSWGTEKSICTINVWNKPEFGKARPNVASQPTQGSWFTGLYLSFSTFHFNFSQHLIHKKGFSLCTDFFSPLRLWVKIEETFSYRNAQELFCMLIYSYISLKYLLSHSCSGRVESAPCGFPVNVIKTQSWSSSTCFWQDAKPHSINVNMHLHSV